MQLHARILRLRSCLLVAPSLIVCAFSAEAREARGLVDEMGGRLLRGEEMAGLAGLAHHHFAIFTCPNQWRIFAARESEWGEDANGCGEGVGGVRGGVPLPEDASACRMRLGRGNRTNVQCRDVEQGRCLHACMHACVRACVCVLTCDLQEMCMLRFDGNRAFAGDILQPFGRTVGRAGRVHVRRRLV